MYRPALLSRLRRRFSPILYQLLFSLSRIFWSLVEKNLLPPRLVLFGQTLPRFPIGPKRCRCDQGSSIALLIHVVLPLSHSALWLRGSFPVCGFSWPSLFHSMLSYRWRSPGRSLPTVASFPLQMRSNRRQIRSFLLILNAQRGYCGFWRFANRPQLRGWACWLCCLRQQIAGKLRYLTSRRLYRW